MSPMTERDQIHLLVTILDQAYDHPSWHGTNLRGSIRRVSPAQASWRPGPSRHNIWELVVHAAYWKYAAWRRLAGAERGSFPIKGSNWFRRPPEVARSQERVWKADIALMDQVHASLRERVARLSPRDLHLTPRGSKVSNVALISGVAAHDLYHAGQIQLLKRLSVTAS